MILSKWNCKEHKYEDYIVPSTWKVSLYEADMETIVNCPHCGKEVKYGETYTSKQFHNWAGLGFSACSECYEKEWKEEREARESENGIDN